MILRLRRFVEPVNQLLRWWAEPQSNRPTVDGVLLTNRSVRFLFSNRSVWVLVIKPKCWLMDTILHHLIRLLLTCFGFRCQLGVVSRRFGGSEATAEASQPRG